MIHSMKWKIKILITNWWVVCLYHRVITRLCDPSRKGCRVSWSPWLQDSNHYSYCQNMAKCESGWQFNWQKNYPKTHPETYQTLGLGTIKRNPLIAVFQNWLSVGLGRIFFTWIGSHDSIYIYLSNSYLLRRPTLCGTFWRSSSGLDFERSRSRRRLLGGAPAAEGTRCTACPAWSAARRHSAAGRCCRHYSVVVGPAPIW